VGVCVGACVCVGAHGQGQDCVQAAHAGSLPPCMGSAACLEGWMTATRADIAHLAHTHGLVPLL